MDEKEAVTKIRNSFKSGMTRAQITRKLQNKGYKLEYIDALIKKANKPKKILILIAIIAIVLIAGLIASYSLVSTGKKQTFTNPLLNTKVDFSKKLLQSNSAENTVNIEDIHKNPLTFEKPYLSFDISGKKFYSSISTNKIETFEGTTDSADIEFVSGKEDIVKAILSENPTEVFKQSIQQQRTKINKISGDIELAAKGYLSLYDSLK